MMRIFYIFIFYITSVIDILKFHKINLPLIHYQYYCYSNPSIEDCVTLKTKKCWGYEKNCSHNNILLPICDNDQSFGIKDIKDKANEFWRTGDFGFVKERQSEIKDICIGKNSNLKCSKYLKYCVATNLYMDFTNSNLNKGTDRFREDIFPIPGKIGGNCEVNKKILMVQGEHKSPLQSWYAEIENFSSISEPICEITLHQPTVFMKLDAGINMYHHFCDFINLYISQHINASFSTDINIVMWDTSPLAYGDFFKQTWKVFTDFDIIKLSSFNGKKICVNNAMFALPPRQIFGLYYNMPLINGCNRSHMVQAFSEHVLFRLNISQVGPLWSKIRVTLLLRGSKYRNILNSEELISALKTVGQFDVKIVLYNHSVEFIDQLRSTYNSDVFIGMHGAGLTHLLFLPKWATIIELYNCDDPTCYKDLARLKGIDYLTWQNPGAIFQEDEGHHPTMGAHKKFTNYSFDVGEFMKLIWKGVELVYQNLEFMKAWRDQWGSLKQDL